MHKLFTFMKNLKSGPMVKLVTFSKWALISSAVTCKTQMISILQIKDIKVYIPSFLLILLTDKSLR